MNSIKELSFDEIALVSGGNGADSAERDRQLNAARKAREKQQNRDIYAGTDKCVGEIVSGIGKGAITGGISGAFLGVLGAANECLSGSSAGNNNGCNAGSSNCSGGNAANTCNR